MPSSTFYINAVCSLPSQIKTKTIKEMDKEMSVCKENTGLYFLKDAQVNYKLEILQI